MQVHQHMVLAEIPYAMSKYSLEQIAPENSLGMRFTTVYRPSAKPNMLILKF